MGLFLRTWLLPVTVAAFAVRSFIRFVPSGCRIAHGSGQLLSPPS